jgi:hypothetical protein
MVSFVHEKLESIDRLSEFHDNRPKSVRCVHPLVTLLEKLQAIVKKHGAGKPAPDFVRHYDDAARIIEAAEKLPELDGGLPGLVREMRATDLKSKLRCDDPAFLLTPCEQTDELVRASDEITHMFWGEKLPLRKAAQMIGNWLQTNHAHVNPSAAL